MSEREDLRSSIRSARSVVKMQSKSLRTLLSVLTDLEERLDALEDAQPKEAQRNGTDTNARRRVVA